MSKLEDQIEIANPTQPHCAVALLVDVSGSMAGNVSEVFDGLKRFKEEVQQDELASLRVDLAVVTFGGSVAVAHQFSGIEDFEPPALTANGGTPMGDAILKALEMIEDRKKQYKTRGIDHYRPWVFLFTDGEPTDMTPGDPKWQEVVTKVRDGETAKKFLFFAVGVEGANLSTLGAIAPTNRPPVKLVGKKFREMFEWLSKSMGEVSRSRIGDQLQVQNPVAAGWAEIPT